VCGRTATILAFPNRSENEAMGRHQQPQREIPIDNSMVRLGMIYYHQRKKEE
jgi:hypothetical protein